MVKQRDPAFYGTEKPIKILLKIAPPVMAALLIQALYNVVDSLFIGKYDPAGNGLNALSVIYTMQLIIIALAVGTGVGVNTYMAKLYAEKKEKDANYTAGVGAVLSVAIWIVFSVLSVLVLKPFIKFQCTDKIAQDYAYRYGIIVCIGSIGVFTEGNFTKVHQAEGNMLLPTIAQITGAVINVILDPVLIFGWWIFPELGVEGAAIATIIGQIVAAIITGVKGLRKPPELKSFGRYIKKIYYYGYPSILMQSAFTVYIVALNAILATFCKEAVTVLGLYYKVQSFFWIPLIGLQTCIVPVISYNYAIKRYDRIKSIMNCSFVISAVTMLIGIICFEFLPTQIISVFNKTEKVLSIGKIAFPIIGISFAPATFSFIIPTLFQSIGNSVPSVILTLLRQIFGLIPLFYLFSLIGLNYTWIAFPVAESITAIVGVALYVVQLNKWKKTPAVINS